mgnify:CR=1 FL=1
MSMCLPRSCTVLWDSLHTPTCFGWKEWGMHPQLWALMLHVLTCDLAVAVLGLHGLLCRQLQ